MPHHDLVNTSETVSQNETLLFYLCRVCCHSDKKSAYANELAVNTNASQSWVNSGSQRIMFSLYFEYLVMEH